jgi:glycosyltransferase involved in cell wall biosynthesis
MRRFGPQWMRGDVDSAAFGGLGSVRCLRYPGVPGARFRRLSNRSMDFRLGDALARMLRQAEAQLVHVHTEGLAPAAVQTAHASGVRSVVTLHGINTDRRYLHARAQRDRIGGALNDVDRVVLVGEPLRSFFKDFVGRDDHFRVVPNGFDASALPPHVRPLLQPCATVRFISVSHLHEGKGIDIALRALARVRERGLEDWAYTIVGSGYQRDELVALTYELGLDKKITFAGAQPPRRVFELLAEADVFVLPSYREAFGIAYLEAMATGLVTIGVRGEGPSAFIESGRNGFLVEPRDPEDLAKLLLQISADPERMRAIGAAGRETVRSGFTWDAHADKLLACYREMLQHAPNQNSERSAWAPADVVQ